MKNFTYFLEYVAFLLGYGFFKILGPERASNVGSWLGRTCGPHLGVNNVARKNLVRALRMKDTHEQDRVLTGMWDNLGRTLAEYAHLAEIAKNNVLVDPKDLALLDTLRAEGRPCLFIGAHLANWEIAFMTLLQRGYKVDLMYRALNNPYVEKNLAQIRSLNGMIDLYPKSRVVLRQVLRALQKGGWVGLLIDQKFNEGVPVPFFGLPAMTATAFIDLAKRENCSIIAGWLERTEGPHFKATIEQIPTAGSVEEIMAQIHVNLEERIRAHPEQWLWVHKRWG